MRKQRIIETSYNFLLRAAFILLANVFSTLSSRGQEMSSLQVVNTGERTDQLVESLALWSDRDTYVAGEDLRFRIFNLSPAALKDPLWSRIVYVELLGLDNKPLIQQKLRLTEDGVYGTMSLPGSSTSGYYYIRAYTRWMRNFPASDYPSRIVRIFNPTKDEVSILKNGNGNAEYRVAGGYANSQAGLPSMEATVRAGQKVYGRRQKVSLEIRVPNGMVDNGLCLTVVRKEVLDSSLHLEYRENLDIHITEPGDWEYIPETRGMTISGKVIMQGGGRAVPNARVQLSLIGDEPDYFACQTGDDGRFYIPLPDYHGTKDFYINSETQLTQRNEILIDQDFSTNYVIPKQVPLRIKEEEKPVLEEMLVNSQVNDFYRQKGQAADSSARSAGEALYFYGEPWFTVRIEDYVKLPTLEEFIFELVPEILIKRSGGRKQLLVTGEHSDLAIYTPLVLLDHVAVTDLDAILDVSPERIESIDLIIGSYIRGNITYGGLLSITSRNRDLAGIDLPDDSYFFIYTTLSIPSSMRFPDYSADPEDLRNPDFRNCLYWEPVMKKDDEGIFKSEFYTSDHTGEYIAVVRGFNTSGRPVYGSTTLRVE